MARPHFASPFERFFDFPGRGVPDGQLPPQLGSGSGFIIGSEGVIVTNNHVVDGATTIRVRLHDGREYLADVVGKDAAGSLLISRTSTSSDCQPMLAVGATL